MSIVATFRSAVYSTSNTAATYTGTTAYTPAAGSLLVCFVCTTYSSSPSDPTSVTGHGLSYTQVPLGTSTLSTTHKLSCWVAKAGGSPSSVAPVANVTTTNGTGGVLIEFEVTGVELSDASVLAALVDSSATNTGTSTTPTVVLKSPGNTANRALLFVTHLSATSPTGSGNWAIDAGASGSFSSPATGAAVLKDATFETAGAATTANVAWRMVGIEIKADLALSAAGLRGDRPYAMAVSGGGVTPPATPGLKGERGRPGPALRALMRHVDTARFEQPGQASASQPVGTGTLIADAATASGAGVSGSVGAGALTDQSATVSGAGVSKSTGSGTLSAQAAAIAGAGVSESVASGALTDAAASVAGAGVSESTGSAVLSASAATLAGAGVSSSTGDGALDAQAAVVAGVGGAPAATGSGALGAAAATVSGAGVTASVGAGALVDGTGSVAASGVSESVGSGVLVAAPATVSGTSDLVGSGVLSADAATVSGAGTVTGSVVTVELPIVNVPHLQLVDSGSGVLSAQRSRASGAGQVSWDDHNALVLLLLAA